MCCGDWVQTLPPSASDFKFLPPKISSGQDILQGEGGLYLLPPKTKVIPFQLVPQPEDVGKLLQVKKTEILRHTSLCTYQ